MKETVGFFIVVIAVAICVRVFAQKPKDTFESLFNEGIRLHDSQNFAAAIEKYKEAVKFAGDHAAVFHELAVSYGIARDY